MANKDILLSKWSRTSCIKYKKGTVMIVEDSEDVNQFQDCFKPIPISKLRENTVYQYIVSNKHIKLMPTMRKNEIGSKHDCLVKHFGDDELILSSGELIKKGKAITYSCMSSLFLTLINIIIKKEKIKIQDRLKYKENYEKNEVKKQLQRHFIGFSITYQHNIKGKKKKFNPESLCKVKNPPKCMRYMKEKDCKVQLDNPNGPDCEAGVDFCGSLNIDVIPDVIIKETDYIFRDQLDMEKVKEYFKSKGKTNLKPQALKLYMDRDKDFKEKDFTTREVFWPILEKGL